MVSSQCSATRKWRSWLAASAVSAFAVIAFSAFAADNQPAPQAQPGAEHAHHGMVGGRCAMLERIDKHLTPEQIHDIFAGRLAERGEGTLKIGKVAPKEPGVVTVEIDTLSGSLVSTREISTKTGGPASFVKRCAESQQQGAAGGEHHGWDGKAGGRGFGMMMKRHHHGGMGDLAWATQPGRDLNLNVDQARRLAEAELIRIGNPRLKVGAVKEKDADTITVDIDTVDNALVARREINRHTGRMHGVRRS